MFDRGSQSLQVGMDTPSGITGKLEFVWLPLLVARRGGACGIAMAMSEIRHIGSSPHIDATNRSAPGDPIHDIPFDESWNSRQLIPEVTHQWAMPNIAEDYSSCAQPVQADCG